MALYLFYKYLLTPHVLILHSAHQMIFNNMNFFICLHLFIFSIPFLLQTTHSLNCMQNEKLALLKFKSELIDDYDRLSTWGTSKKDEQNCCKWAGVLCHNRTNHVVALDLGGPSNVPIERDAPLRGKISSSLLELSDLSYLDLSSNDFNGTQIPDFFGSLSKLRYLNLNLTNFGGLIPQGLGNLSLSYLDLSANNFTGGIPESLGNILSLSHFDLSLNKLEGKIPDSLGNLISISFLDFSDNQLQGEVPTFKNLSSLRFLDFSGNKFSGQASNVMNSLWNSSMLEILDLSENFFYGSLPRIPRFRFLKELRLQSNEFNGSFVEGNLRLPSLEVLDVSENRFLGSVPNLSLCYSLRVLNLTDNMFNGTLTQSIGYLSKLEYLGLGSNHLEGIISEPNLFNLSNLQKLDLSFNTNLTIRVASNWNPPFRLDTIRLAYCELGPRFPEWLRNQTLVQDLDISNAKIFDTIPHWFWDNSESLLTVNMSSNKIYGVLPDLASKLVSLASVDLSSNELNGSLPLFPPDVAVDLSNNSFSGTIGYFCNSSVIWDFLDLSKNQLSGDISEYCFERLMSAKYLNLADNNLSGMVPNATNLSCALFSLHLRNNSFRGEIPMSLRDCGFMHVLDFSENNFTGKIPAWIGEKMKDLGVLSLRANKFYGSLPLSLCRLAKVQVLDISMNKISGNIPKCVNNFTILSSKLGSNTWDDDRYIVYSDDVPIYDSAYIMWKGKQAEYVHSLTLLKAIDFSNNNLAGEIPFEITSLEGLMSMNLSRNDFVGSIPRDIGRLGLLNVLDLSHNNISGDIPLALTQLSHLGILDLSFNNLSGKIPWRNHLQTFSDSAFMGNPGLCGSALLFEPCPEDEMRKSPDSNGNVNVADDVEHKDMFITRGFYISMALGFIVSFWAVFGTLLLKKPKKLITIEDWLYKGFGE